MVDLGSPVLRSTCRIRSIRDSIGKTPFAFFLWCYQKSANCTRPDCLCHGEQFDAFLNHSRSPVSWTWPPGPLDTSFNSFTERGEPMRDWR